MQRQGVRPPCKEIAPRDLLFIVDASDSIDREKFYTSTLDFIQHVVCVLNVGQNNQAGLIIFNSEIRAAILLGTYSPEQWFDAIEAIRADPTVCCLKGTPHAEAFDMATSQFQAFGKAPYKVAMVISDGYPWQLFTGQWAWPMVDEAKYRYSVVQREAAKLKALGVRIMMVVVPRKDGIPPSPQYFLGIPQDSWRPPPSANIANVNSMTQ